MFGIFDAMRLIDSFYLPMPIRIADRRARFERRAVPRRAVTYHPPGDSKHVRERRMRQIQAGKSGMRHAATAFGVGASLRAANGVAV